MLWDFIDICSVSNRISYSTLCYQSCLLEYIGVLLYLAICNHTSFSGREKKLCENYCRQYGVNFISAMPTNLYGLNDNFDLANSHVLPALMRKFHEAKIANQPTVEVWGSGTPLRELMYVDDLAEGLIFLMDNYTGTEFINIGSGKEISIKDLAFTIKDVVGYTGDIVFDSSKPDGTPRKLMVASKLTNLGWQAKTSLEQGITQTYEWFQLHYESLRGV